MQPTPLCPAHLLVADVSIWAASLLAVAVRCIFSVSFFFFFFFLVMLPSEIPKPPRHAPERVSYCVETSPPSSLPCQDRSLSLTLLSIFLSFIFCPTSFQREMGCLSGCQVSCTSVQKLFCGSCSAFKWSFDEFVGDKVVSPSCSSAILGPNLLSSYLLNTLPLHEVNCGLDISHNSIFSTRQSIKIPLTFW